MGPDLDEIRRDMDNRGNSQTEDGRRPTTEKEREQVDMSLGAMRTPRREDNDQLKQKAMKEAMAEIDKLGLKIDSNGPEREEAEKIVQKYYEKYGVKSEKEVREPEVNSIQAEERQDVGKGEVKEKVGTYMRAEEVSPFSQEGIEVSQQIDRTYNDKGGAVSNAEQMAKMNPNERNEELKKISFREAEKKMVAEGINPLSPEGERISKEFDEKYKVKKPDEIERESSAYKDPSVENEELERDALERANKEIEELGLNVIDDFEKAEEIINKHKKELGVKTKEQIEKEKIEELGNI